MFKRGVTYKRDEIASMARPDSPPLGGDWTTGYARIENDLYVFMSFSILFCCALLHAQNVDGSDIQIIDMGY
ncbi:hypothetical protein N8500_09355 [Candidatus Puniceispirillum sp.]|nr:hypothetical protein [Candidatus Puniceispirillum sp.]